MRIFAFLIILFSIVKSFAQVDTVRYYYQNGQVRSEHPMLNGNPYGTVKYFYLNGRLESELKIYNKSGKMIQKHYYKNGILKLNIVYKNNLPYILKSYDSLGSLDSLEKNSRKGKITKHWHANKTLASIEKYKNGEPIYCITMSEIANGEKTEKEICYYKYKPVFWKESIYIDSEGMGVNQSFKYELLEYYENGRKKSSIIQKGITRKRMEWDSLGHLLIKTTEGIKVEPIFISNDSSVVTIEKPWPEEGGPILKTKNPLRDTTLQSNYISLINDSLINYKFTMTYFNSMGLETSTFSFYGTASKYLPKANDETSPFLIDYEIYSTGENEYFLAIGIKKDNPKIIILFADQFYKNTLRLKEPLINSNE